MPDSADRLLSHGRRARLRRAVRRSLLSRRRPLAALCAAVAVVGVVRATHPAPPPTVTVPVAARDLVSGAVLDPGDVVLRQVPRALAPQHSVTAAVGRILAGPVRAGEPITDVRLVSSSLLSGFPGRVALPVRIADPDAVGLLRAGDHIDLVAADPRRGTASYVAVEVPVLSLPPPTADAASAGTPGRLVVVAVTTSEVDDIAGAAASDLLSVVISR